MNKKFEFIREGKIKKQFHTEIICIIDRSGSMNGIKDDAIGGFNTFLEEQKKLKGSATLSLILFDDHYEEVYENVDLKEVENLTEQTFVPRGSTALLDAIGKTINKYEKLQRNNSKVIVCILTDGKENQSCEFSADQIKTLIESKRKEQWEFCFLAANQDAFNTASDYGILRQHTANFAATADGTRDAYATMSRLVGDYRTNDS